jgi:SAM-dependent methyltransferase
MFRVYRATGVLQGLLNAAIVHDNIDAEVEAALAAMKHLLSYAQERSVGGLHCAGTPQALELLDAAEGISGRVGRRYPTRPGRRPRRHMNDPVFVDFLALTRDGYDRTAAAYADRFHHHLDDKPIDVAVVKAFAGLVMKSQNQTVIDVGCGTGVSTALLAQCGVDVAGVDLSPNMVAQAQGLNPGLRFSVGSMTNLQAAEGSVGGICAWYSVIHIPDEYLPGVFDEFARVLVPGGLVLLAFQVGDEPRVLTNAFGQDVHLTFIRRRPQWVWDQLAGAGFGVHTEVVRQPDIDSHESTPQAYLIARKLV